MVEQCIQTGTVSHAERSGAGEWFCHARYGKDDFIWTWLRGRRESLCVIFAGCAISQRAGVEQNEEKAIAYLTASAELGNQYAGQLLHSIRNNWNWV